MLNGLALGELSDLGNRRNVREEGGIGHHVRLLIDSVKPLRRQDAALGKTVVEHAKSSAKHGLGAWIIFVLAGRPSESDTRRKIAPIMNIRLGLPAEAEAHR